jgi:S-(hydroxymethyl)glutathione dehydrogenase/alcohol dehydrogenase
VLADENDAGLSQAAQKVRNLTQLRGADYAFECTAVPALGAAPLAMIRHGGMAIQVSGIEQEIKIDMNLFEWDKIYLNPLYGKTKPQIDFPIIQDLYQSGKLKLDELITSQYQLEKLADAFEDMHSGKNAKGAVVFTD